MDSVTAMTVGKGELKSLTAEQVAKYFAEWKAKSGSKRQIPTARMCAKIAEMQIRPCDGGLPEDYFDDASQIDSVIGYGHYDDIPKNDTLKRQYYEVLNTTNVLLSLLKRFEKTLQNKNYPAPYNKLPMEFEGIKEMAALQNVALMISDRRQRGRPVADNFFAGDVAYHCRDALIAAGWKNPSLDSRDGPVAYVVTKIIKYAEGKNLTPAGAATRIRTANRDSKRLDGDTFLEWYGRS
jgi:hypothetical protein